MREHALQIFHAAVKAVEPSVLLPRHIKVEKNTLQLNDRPFSLDEWGGIYIIGAGKASAAMALETENILGEHITEGIIVTKYGHSLPLQKIKCMEAGHPIPDDNSVLAGNRILQLVQGLKDKDLIIALISGGASALLADHPPGTGLQEVQELFRLLLHSGATVHEMNTVRKHLSLIKGGGLSRAAYPATIVSFILSDVTGDPLDVIASGPTVPDPTTFSDAYAVLKKYNLLKEIPASIYQWIQKGKDKVIPDTPKPGDPVFERSTNHLIGTNRIALEAAVEKARQLGYEPFIVNDGLTGEAGEEAVVFIRQIMQQKYRAAKPACLLMGGETTVTIKGKGKGGRNQEFALAALCELMNRNEKDQSALPVVLSAGTDGSDGPTEVTGAVIDQDTIKKIKELQLDPQLYLENNDSYHFFEKAGGHVVTGPTHTNVMDVVIALIP